MAYKALRNKAYKDSPMVCNFNWDGQEWLSNSYISEVDTEHPRLSKDIRVYEQEPDVTSIFANLNFSSKVQVYSQLDDETMLITVDAGDGEKIQKIYYDYFMGRYLDCTMHLDASNRNAPVLVKNNNRKIGVIMPLRSK